MDKNSSQPYSGSFSPTESMLMELRANAALWKLFTNKEEYSPKRLDKWDVFSYSLSKNKDVLEPRVSDFFINQGLRAMYPDGKRFAICLTHDVDNLYPSLIHIGLSSLCSVKTFRFRRMKEQLIWKFGKRQLSPYNNFSQIMEIERQFGAKSTFYFMATDRDILRSRYRIDELGDELKSIVENGWEVGLHTGYYSFDNLESIIYEKQRLEQTVGREIVGSRNHYLRFKTPDSWQLLSKAGFKYDTTFGYNDAIGFRNGMCHPFRPFDLNRERIIDIVEIPLNVMDGALFEAMKLGYDGALAHVKRIIDAVERRNGVITLLWHSHIFGCPFRDRWAELYKTILEYCRGKNAWMTSADEICQWFVRERT